MTQKEAVLLALDNLGGLATLPQIYKETFAIGECKWGTKTPEATVRRLVRHTPGIIVVRKGLYALEDYRETLKDQGVMPINPKDKEETNSLNHTYYQGLLVLIGNLKQQDTFIPSQDKNRKFYDGRKLHELASLSELPPYTYPEVVKRSSTIDTVWMNNRRMPHSFFEVEHTTDIQNSLLKFIDLQDFNVRMVIVADKIRKREYEHKLSLHAFDELRNNKRVNFLSYDDLVRQYEQEEMKNSMSFRL